MNGQPELYRLLNELNINYEYYEHPPAPTIEIAKEYWKNINSVHCKNIFLRNHKGNKHYLVIAKQDSNIDIHLLEKKLKQGKLSFASDKRLMTYLGLLPGSVSPFGLINDVNHEVYVFIDENLKNTNKVSFHPNVNTASLVISIANLEKFINNLGNTFSFIKLSET